MREKQQVESILCKHQLAEEFLYCEGKNLQLAKRIRFSVLVDVEPAVIRADRSAEKKMRLVLRLTIS